ncbi:MAG: hypothetical protein ACWGQW_14225, partial [bacterium]
MAVATNLTTVDSCEGITGWSAHNISGAVGTLGAIQASDEEAPPVEGTYCLSYDIDIENGGYVYEVNASGEDWSAQTAYIWLLCMTAASLQVLTPGSGQSGVYFIAID